MEYLINCYCTILDWHFVFLQLYIATVLANNGFAVVAVVTKNVTIKCVCL